MLTVLLLYSSKDFLNLCQSSLLSQEDFTKYFKSYKYSEADDILKISFKCGWAKLTKERFIELTDRGLAISACDYQSALLFQIEDYISNYNPPWASLLAKGRTEARSFLPSDALQCFKESGLLGKLTNDLVKIWDRLSLAYRNFAQIHMVEIGRIGEKLSYEFELERTGQLPLWQSVESNLAGFDLLSVVNKDDQKKLKIEVKTTTANINYATVHITKNEWETGINSNNYIFHLWDVKENSTLYVVSFEQVSKHIPMDCGLGSWENVAIPFKSLIEN